MDTNNTFNTLFSYPSVALEQQYKTICSYLTEAEVRTLKTSPLSERSPFFRNILQRLHTIDLTISPDLPNNLNKTLQNIIIGLTKIQCNQTREIKELCKSYSQKKLMVPQELQNIDHYLTLDSDLRTQEKLTLAKFETINAVFNKININLISSKIDQTSTMLDLKAIGITRIPHDIFKDNKLENYWKKITHIDCSQNPLQALPQSITTLVHLECLNIADTPLAELPESINMLTKLQSISLNTINFYSYIETQATTPLFVAFANRSPLINEESKQEEQPQQTQQTQQENKNPNNCITM